MRRPPVLVLIALLAARGSADCYSHDGIAALDSKYYTGPELVSCGNGTNNCCLSGEKCGSNLLCVDPDGGLSRQYCHDKNWDACSTLCPESNAAGLSLLDCGDNLFCCGASSDSSCCDNQGDHFFVDPKNGDVKDPSKASATTSGTWWSVNSTSLLAATSTSTSTSMSSSSSGTPTITPTDTPTNTSTGTADSDKKNKLSSGAAAGIGIGAAVGVAAVIAGAWFLLRRKRRNVVPGPVGDSHAQEFSYAGGYVPTPKDDKGAYQNVPAYSDPVVEAPTSEATHELPGNSRHEMG